jgi:hypothetical protein
VVCLHRSGTRRSIAATCRRFTAVCRNHSGTPQSFKNPYISMISSRFTSKTTTTNP